MAILGACDSSFLFLSTNWLILFQIHMEHHSISRKKQVSYRNLCMDLQDINAAAYTKTDNNAKKMVMNCFKATLDSSIQMCVIFDNNTLLIMLES